MGVPVTGVQVNDLSVVVGDQVILAPTTFVVRPGQSLAVIGPSGSGKSTLLSCLTGWRTPTTGTVIVGDHLVSTQSRTGRAKWRRDRVGMMQQDAHLLDELTVRENVELVLSFRGTVTSSAQRVGHVMDALAITHMADGSVDTLSGGERQRVSVARALVNACDLLVADEPTASLDRQHADDVAEELITTAAAIGAPLVLATHDPRVASRCDAVVNLGERT